MASTADIPTEYLITESSLFHFFPMGHDTMIPDRMTACAPTEGDKPTTIAGKSGRQDNG
jgi:hypothetical protein